MNINFNNKRVAVYIRVSTEEQAINGYSLDAQKETLDKFVLDNKMILVDHYIDDGYSARKKYSTRKEFMRMINDVENNLIDVILFIKLDRWFRSVSDYYKVQEILEKHNVVWKTVLENYETATANGRLHVNIRLSVAQDESDRTSERIKYVFESKVARGEVITGSLPLGFKIENKKVVEDISTSNIVLEIFNHFDSFNSARATTRYLREVLGVNICYDTIHRILRNTMYKGLYRGIDNYCPAIISSEVFDNIQILLSKNIKISQKYCYIFSGLLFCGECNHKMTGYSAGPVYKNKKTLYRYYKCRHNSDRALCSFNKSLREDYIEDYLINNIKSSLVKLYYEFNTVSTSSTTTKHDNTKIKKKLSRLKDLYMNELISLEEYRSDFKMYNDLLEKEVSSPVDLSPALAVFQNDDWISNYKLLSSENKRRFWRHTLSKVIINGKDDIEIKFF